MPQFHYQALKDNGERVSGRIEGADRSLVLSRLSGQGLHPIEVREDGVKRADARRRSRRIADEEITIFIRQLAWLIEAGMPLNRALGILAEESFSKPFSAVLVELQSGIRKGRSFHDALADSGVFPAFDVSMVEVGEATGTLAPALARIATARERSAKMRGKVLTALTYPLLLVVLALGAVIFILVSVVPGIKDMIESSGAPIPETARLVISLSDWLIGHGPALAVGCVAGLLLLAFLWRQGSLPRLLHSAAIAMPLVGRILIKAEVAHFCRSLAALNAGGVTLQASLQLIAALPFDKRITGATRAMQAALQRGEDFVAPLESSGIFPPLLARMLKVGSETGNLTPGMVRASDVLEDELDRLVERALALLGPIIILVLSVFVGFIIVSLMSAVISINDLAI